MFCLKNSYFQCNIKRWLKPTTVNIQMTNIFSIFRIQSGRVCLVQTRQTRPRAPHLRIGPWWRETVSSVNPPYRAHPRVPPQEVWLPFPSSPWSVLVPGLNGSRFKVCILTYLLLFFYCGYRRSWSCLCLGVTLVCSHPCL